MSSGPVLICYDGSENARDAIAAAAQLLLERRATVLSVGEPPVVAESYAVPTAPDVLELDELVSEAALARAEEGARLANDAGFVADARADVEAPTWRGVVEIADEIDATAIVVGSRGLSGLRELLEGSLSRELTEHARRPVLIVPPPE